MLIGLALLLPLQAIAADTDSVYSWGAWAQGIKPAAGPSLAITPAPVDQPKVDIRANEASALTRNIKPLPTVVTVPSGTDLSGASPTSGFFN